MHGSATTATARGKDPRASSGKSVMTRLGRLIFAGVFLALTVALVPAAAIYCFIWIAKF
ncbi:MAG TPA: hypothetical protein VGL83_10575 [Stellaceae bacterium]